MSQAYPDALAVSRRVLRILIKLNLVMGFLILVLLLASFVAGDWIMAALSGEHPTDHVHSNTMLVLGMRGIMVIGICSVPLTHIVLARLLAIVETVRDGDPFVTDNAARLVTIAWAIVGLELLHLIVGAIAAGASTETHPLDIDWNFSITRWLAVLLLFVLARVFDHGARMRDDLEGTV
jgi:hypothetical protein